MPLFDRPIAHRGLHNRAAGIIENSRSAFEAAIEAGFTIECDVQLSSDGEPIIFHDDDLERLTGTKGPVCERTADELTDLPLLDSANGDRPQRLGEFLQQVAGRTLLQVEMKRQSPGTTALLARRCAEAFAAYKGPITVESFDPRLISQIGRLGFRGPRGIITYRYDDPADDSGLTISERFALRNLLHWPWTRFDFISCAKDALSLPAVRLFRSRGVPVTSWTIRSPEEAGRALRAADQIVFEGFLPA